MWWLNIICSTPLDLYLFRERRILLILLLHPHFFPKCCCWFEPEPLCSLRLFSYCHPKTSFNQIISSTKALAVLMWWEWGFLICSRLEDTLLECKGGISSFHLTETFISRYINLYLPPRWANGLNVPPKNPSDSTNTHNIHTVTLLVKSDPVNPVNTQCTFLHSNPSLTS